MQSPADGAVTLLPPPSVYVNPVYEFWQRHGDLVDDAASLWGQSEQVPCLCHRFMFYLSTDLYWVTRERASPIVFDAFAAGLWGYRASRDSKVEEQPCTVSLGSYRAFIDGALDHAASRLSSVMLMDEQRVWSPATGNPLQPWLAQQRRDIAVLHRSFGDDHQQRIRTVLRDYVLDRNDRRNVGLEHSS